MKSNIIKKALFVTIGLLFPMSVYSDPRIEHIKKLYSEANQLNCGIGCEHFMHEIKLNTMQPAIGLQTTTIKFFFQSFQQNPEKNPSLLSFHLKKITIEYNISTSAFFHIEYLFDERENLVFHFQKTDTAGGDSDSRRYYFHNNDLIKVIIDDHSPGGDPIKYTAIKNFSSEVRKQGEETSKKGVHYKKLFQSIVEAESWR